jgi:aminopeptidase-like protein
MLNNKKIEEILNLKTKFDIEIGNQMIDWMKYLWNYPRSLTGHGTLDTLSFLKSINPELEIHSYDSGDKVLDWVIPDEWNIYDAYIEHESGKRFAEFSNNNLHVVGYSDPCNIKISLDELLKNIYTQPDQPDAIPYVTSYYNNTWGFCMSENDKNKLEDGIYKVVIDANKGPGKMHLADLVLKGDYNEEIFFSTYVCHPSLANNELSGPVLSSALIRYIKNKYPNPKYSYRFVFAPETIGSISYISDNLKALKSNVICGYSLSCVGDDRAYSYIESRLGGTVADDAIKSALIGNNKVREYSFLERGADERQYCAPGVNLPFCGFSRSKFGEYPEYHTSDDNFDVVTADGLHGSFKVLRSIVDAFEIGIYPECNEKCEPQLGRRNLYPKISQKGSYDDIKLRMDFLAYADGNHSIFDISNKINTNLKKVVSEAIFLKKNNLISISDFK